VEEREFSTGFARGREPERRKRDSSTAQADPFTGVKGEEKIGLLRSEAVTFFVRLSVFAVIRSA